MELYIFHLIILVLFLAIVQSLLGLYDGDFPKETSDVIVFGFWTELLKRMVQLVKVVLVGSGGAPRMKNVFGKLCLTRDMCSCDELWIFGSPYI